MVLIGRVRVRKERKLIRLTTRKIAIAITAAVVILIFFLI